MGKTKAVLFWIDTEQVSVEELSKVDEDDRYVGAKTSVKVGHTYHKCEVRLISGDPLKLKDEEVKICDEIEERLKRQSEADSKKSRSNRQRRTVEGAASANKVAAAMGERLKPLTSEQAKKAKDLAASRKAAEAAQKAAQDEVDQQIMNIDNTTSDTDLQGDLLDQDSDDDHINDSGEESGGDRELQSGEKENMDRSSSRQCCEHCLDLQQACKDSPNYLRAFMRFHEFAEGTETSNGIEYLEVLPVSDGVPKVELSKGAKVYVSVADKNSIKRDGDGDPAKMTRLALVALFGRRNLEATDLTAKGQKKGSKGIRPNVLKALKDFVNRNRGKTYSELKDADFNRVINRKKTQVKRVQSNKIASTSVKKSSITKSPRKKNHVKSPIKSPKATRSHQRSPLKNSPVKKAVSLSPAKSPGVSVRSSSRSLFNSPMKDKHGFAVSDYSNTSGYQPNSNAWAPYSHHYMQNANWATGSAPTADQSSSSQYPYYHNYTQMVRIHGTALKILQVMTAHPC